MRSVDPLALRTAFLCRVSRQVTKAGHVHFHLGMRRTCRQGNRYAVPGFLVGQKVELRHDPFDLREIEVWFNGQCLAQADLVHLQASTQPGVTPDPTPPPLAPLASIGATISPCSAWSGSACCASNCRPSRSPA